MPGLLKKLEQRITADQFGIFGVFVYRPIRAVLIWAAELTSLFVSVALFFAGATLLLWGLGWLADKTIGAWLFLAIPLGLFLLALVILPFIPRERLR